MAYTRNIEEILARSPSLGAADVRIEFPNLEDPMLERLFGGAIIMNKTCARLCQAGLLLRAGHHDRAHAIAQSIGTPDAAFWHAILHRLEGDSANSRYWYARAAGHPVFASLHARAQELIAGAPAFARLVNAPSWDTEEFVAAMERDTSDAGRRLVEAEWELLFDHCYRKAVDA
jgi:hypothetical protein